jgi:ferredoxin-NADP reductase/Na+-translocating ferredoxin:NAD+ oxidoreductase RnfD subunit
MIDVIDRILDRLTMYRLTLYYLAGLLTLGFILSFFGLVPGGPVAIAATTAVLLAVSVGANALFARLSKATLSHEPSIITALILALILGPVSPLSDPKGMAVVALSGLVAIASKYLLAFRRQHVFNPAAAGALFSGLVFGTFASWWVGNQWLLPLVVLGGILVLRKVSRFRLMAVFLVAFLAWLGLLSAVNGLPPDMLLKSVLFIFGQSALLFFAVVMFTEPMTSPKRFPLQAVYAGIVALLYQPQLTILGQNLTPEQALMAGNLFSWLVSPSFKLRLALTESREIGRGIRSFTFARPRGFRHRLGQYMEWSLALPRGDSRGNRRYFSLASSPTEESLMIAARFPPRPSRYKEALVSLAPGELVTAGELAGDFVLPRNRSLPLAFLAGGIGVTPFRSMIKYLHDTGERRDIVLLYSNYTEDEIVFRDVFDPAAQSVGLKTVYTLTDGERVRADWCGSRGFIDADMIRREVPGLAERRYFVSGSAGFVDTMKRVLREAGVPRRAIRSDYFPGYSS